MRDPPLPAVQQARREAEINWCVAQATCVTIVLLSDSPPPKCCTVSSLVQGGGGRHGLSGASDRAQLCPPGGALAAQHHAAAEHRHDRHLELLAGQAGSEQQPCSQGEVFAFEPEQQASHNASPSVHAFCLRSGTCALQDGLKEGRLV